MNIIKRKYHNIILLLCLIFLYVITISELPVKHMDIEKFKESLSISERNNLSVVINIKNFSNYKHLLFLDIIRNINSKNNYYFLKYANGIPLNEDSNYTFDESLIKIVVSNFPDSVFLPLSISLFGSNNPEIILFIEGEDIIDENSFNFKKWFDKANMKIKNCEYDYIFGNFQMIDGNKIGCSILLIKSSIIQHLLYHTNSDTSHVNPFIQLSLSKINKFIFLPLNNIRTSELENIHGNFSTNIECPEIEKNNLTSFCIFLPIFKRDYSYLSFTSFSKQTIKPIYYVIIQNENKIHYNITLLKTIIIQPIYHIWIKNWNSFFYLNHRLASLFPCEFIIKYDDDQWPNDIHLNQKLINSINGKNSIIGHRGFKIKRTFLGYHPTYYKKIKNDIYDHVATPMIIRPFYLKLDARNKIYRLYGSEDISLSLNSWKLCQVTSKKLKLKLIQKQKDGNTHRYDNQIKNIYNNEKDNKLTLFYKTYLYLILSGYIPRRWGDFKLPEKNFINISIEHKPVNIQ